MSRPAAVATLLVEDARVRASRFDFAPGAGTGWHVHGCDDVVMARAECRMRIAEPGGGVRGVTVPAGSAYSRKAGVAQDVINAGAAPVACVEVELKEL